MKKRYRLSEQYIRSAVFEAVNNVKGLVNELNKSTMKSAYDKLRSQGRNRQAYDMNKTFNSMYNGFDQDGDYVKQTDLAGEGPFGDGNQGFSSQSDYTITDPYNGGTYQQMTVNGKRHNVSTNKYADKSRIQGKSDQIRNWANGEKGAQPYRTGGKQPYQPMSADARKMRNAERNKTVESVVNRVMKDISEGAVNELDKPTMQNAYNKLRFQGRYTQAADMNQTFRDMYKGHTEDGYTINQPDLESDYYGHKRPSYVADDNGYSYTDGNNVGGDTPQGWQDRNAKAEQLAKWRNGEKGATPLRAKIKDWQRFTPTNDGRKFDRNYEKQRYSDFHK